jgi:hypothetical protein
MASSDLGGRGADLTRVWFVIERDLWRWLEELKLLEDSGERREMTTLYYVFCQTVAKGMSRQRRGWQQISGRRGIGFVFVWFATEDSRSPEIILGLEPLFGLSARRLVSPEGSSKSTGQFPGPTGIGSQFQRLGGR